MSSSYPTIQNNQLQEWKEGAIATPGFSEFLQETLALTKRLFIQLQRRPSTLAAGIIQPLMWLILFGAMFQNVPQGLFGDNVNYGQFIGAGIIVFTAFGGALNAGLPSITGLGLMAAIILMLVLGVTAFSLGLAFALPGHIELIAVIFVTNLPLLFASTALVPLDFMPRWLSTIASLNPLSYAIEPIRYLYLHSDWTLGSIVMQAPWGDVSMGLSLLLLALFCGGALGLIYPLINRRIA